MRDSRKAIIYLFTTIALSSPVLFIVTILYCYDVYLYYQTPNTILLNTILNFVNNTFDAPILLFYVLVDLLMIKVIKKMSPDSDEYHFAKYGLYGLLIVVGLIASVFFIFY